MTASQPDHTARATDAILEAARTEHDFGGWLAAVLATAAAELGSTAAHRRPVRQLGGRPRPTTRSRHRRLGRRLPLQLRQGERPMNAVQARPSQFQVISLIGNLTRDPETRTTNGGATTISKLRVAIDRGGREGADFVDVAAFGKLAGACEEYLHKGSRVGVTGRLSHREWIDDHGSHRQSLGVVAATVDFLSPKPPSDWHDDIPQPAGDQEVVSVGSADDDIPF